MLASGTQKQAPTVAGLPACARGTAARLYGAAALANIQALHQVQLPCGANVYVSTVAHTQERT